MARPPSVERRRRQRQLGSNASARTKSIRFFRVILPTAINQKKLRIPSKLANRVNGGAAEIRIPDGSVWAVGLVSENGSFFLKNGFAEFVEYYSIRAGFLLTFKWIGLSSFKVSIFDETTFEIEYPIRSNNVESDDDGSVKIIKSSTRRKDCRRFNKCKVEEEVIVVDLSDEEDDQQGNPNEKQVEVIVSEKYHNLKVSPSCERAMEAAESYNPKSHAFISMVRPYNRRLHVPKKFVDKYMGMVCEEIGVEDPKGSVWAMKVHKTERDFSLGRGWLDFFHFNNLKEGDVCVFEIMDSSHHFMFKASIFPA